MSQIQIFIRLQVWNLNGKFKKEKKKGKVWIRSDFKIKVHVELRPVALAELQRFKGL